MQGILSLLGINFERHPSFRSEIGRSVSSPTLTMCLIIDRHLYAATPPVVAPPFAPPL